MMRSLLLPALLAPLAALAQDPVHAPSPVPERDDPLSPASLLSRDLNDAGNVLVRWLRPDGAIVAREVSAAGEILGEAADGSVLDLPAIGAERYPDGRLGLLVQDAYGALLRFALGDDGGAGEAVIVEDAPGL